MSTLLLPKFHLLLIDFHLHKMGSSGHRYSRCQPERRSCGCHGWRSFVTEEGVEEFKGRFGLVVGEIEDIQSGVKGRWWWYRGGGGQVGFPCASIEVEGRGCKELLLVPGFRWLPRWFAMEGPNAPTPCPAAVAAVPSECLLIAATHTNQKNENKH